MPSRSKTTVITHIWADIKDPKMNSTNLRSTYEYIYLCKHLEIAKNLSRRDRIPCRRSRIRLLRACCRDGNSSSHVWEHDTGISSAFLRYSWYLKVSFSSGTSRHISICSSQKQLSNTIIQHSEKGWSAMAKFRTITLLNVFFILVMPAEDSFPTA